MARRPIRKSGYTSDEIRNARRRFARQAERYEKQAAQASGIEASRKRQLARTSLEKAISLYDDPTKAGQNNKAMRGLINRLNPRIASKSLSDAQQKAAVRESSSFLASAFKDPEKRSEREAEILMSGDAGNYIYAATSDIWEGKENYPIRDQLIMEHFGVESMAEVIDAITSAGIDIFKDREEEYKYDEIVSAINLAFA